MDLRVREERVPDRPVTPREERSLRIPGGTAVVLLVMSLAALVFSRTVADPDLWGHLRFGADKLEAGGVVGQDPYSYLSGGQMWFNHEWATEVLLAALFQAFGPTGLVVLKIVVSLVIVGALYRRLYVAGLDVVRGGLLLLPPMLLLTPGLATVRPHMFTYLSFLMVLEVLRRADEGRPALLWVLVPVFVLWVNLHGGVLAGLGMLGLWAVIRVVQALWGRVEGVGAGAATAALFGAAGATLVNPYGWHHLWFLVRTTAVSRPEISEWQPLGLVSLLGAVYLITLALVVVAILGRERRIDPARGVMLGVLTLMPLVAIRHTMLFAIGAVVLASDHLGDAFGRGRTRLEHRPKALTPSLAVVSLFLLWSAVPNAGCIGVEGMEAGVPVAAVRVLDASGAEGNLAVFFDWGDYVIWHLGERVKVSVDGRRETVYPEDVYQQNLRFHFGRGDWDDLLERHPTELALVPTWSPAANLLLLKPGWTRAYQDRVASIFVLEGSDQARLLADVAGSGWEAADEGGRCFPEAAA